MGPKTPDPAPPIYPIDILLQIPARELVMIDCAAYHGIHRRGKVSFLGNDGMQTKRLGKSAVVVSKICMGTMTFGNQADEATSFRILDKTFGSRINFFDTVENYPVPPSEEWAGRTEEIVGRWIKTKRRDAVILATKVCGPSHGRLEGLPTRRHDGFGPAQHCARHRGQPEAVEHRLCRSLPDSLARSWRPLRGKRFARSMT
jgi:hypothetical protein